MVLCMCCDTLCIGTGASKRCVISFEKCVKILVFPTSVLVTLCAQEAVGHLLSGRFVTPVTTVTPGFRLRTDCATAGTAPGQWLGRIAEASPQRHVPSWKVQTKGLSALCENM